MTEFDLNLYRNRPHHPALQNIDPDDNLLNDVYLGLTADTVSKYYSIDRYNATFNDGGQSINIIAFNTRSFNKNGEIFSTMLKSLHRLPDIIVLSETWGVAGEIDDLSLEGYSSLHTTREVRRSGGVSVYATSNMHMRQIEELSVCSPTIETCVAELKTASITVIVFAVYRPHSDSIANFNQQQDVMLQSPLIKNKSIILLGDINVDLLKHFTQPVANFVDIMQSLSFIPVITKPTRFPSGERDETPSLLDHIWLNSLTGFSSGVLCTDITDHCPTFVNVPIARREDGLIKLIFRTHSPVNFDNFKDKIKNYINNLTYQSDVNALTDTFSENLHSIYSSCFPVKVKYVSNKRLCKPWLSSAILKSIKTKSQYFKLFKLGLISAELNKTYRNRLNSTIRAAKQAYYNKAFTDCRNDIRGTWKLIKKLLSKNSKSRNVKSLLINNNVIVDNNCIAEHFNNYFSSIAQTLDERIPHTNVSAFRQVSENMQSSLFFSPTTPGEISLIIKQMKNSSNNINQIPTRILKQITDIISEPISKIVNRSMECGVFPDSLKVAKIVPIYKSGDTQIVSNYRPIAILPWLSKIFEKCISTKIMNFLIKFNIISLNQFGFLKGKSTVDAFHKLAEHIYSCLNEKQHCIGIFIDLKKAFDTVNHEILLKKLEMCGVRGVPLRWFASYLLERRLRVSIDGYNSVLKTINVGVPQGSVLGPILFLVYINDLPNVSNLFSSILYADDTTLLMNHSNYEQLIQTINNDIPNLIEWINANRLSLNLDKTYAMLSSNLPNIDHTLSIIFNGSPIKFKTHEDFLGLLVDTGLKFTEHIRYISNKLSKSVGILYKLKDYVPQRVLINLYYSLVYPYLLYGNTVWGGTFDQHLEPLKLIQKKILRIITGSEYLAHTNPLFYQTNILKVSDLHKYLLAQYMFKLREINPEIFDRQHSYYTRYRNDAQAAFNRLTLTQHSLSYAGPHIWNELPRNIRESKGLAQFRHLVKGYYINGYN